MYEGVDTVVLYEELAYEDLLSIRWTPLSGAPDPVMLASAAESNLKLLQAAAALQEHGQPEKQDESPHHADIVRLDMKINLLLELVGHILAANQPRPETSTMRFNARGAVWRHKANMPAVGDMGVLEIYLRECIVEPLRLTGQVTGVSPDGKVKVKFIPPGQAISDLIEKLAFRRHRRQVAVARNPKKQ